MPAANGVNDGTRPSARHAVRPFPSCPQVARYFPATSIEESRKRLTRAIERGDGPGLVIGAPGTGKSLLLQLLAAQYREPFDVVLLACTSLCTRRALLQAILFELGLPYRSRDEGQLRLRLLDQLLANEPATRGLLLLVDEAQSWPVPLLDELRMLTNVVRGGVPHVRLVLAGSPALEECFASPELESFSQRLAVRSYLSNFTRQETVQYIRAQIAASGGAPDLLFDDGAMQAIFDATDGTPRLINQLCDRSLAAIEEIGQTRIDLHVVQAAWSDLQQLPTAWPAPGIQVDVGEPQSSVIEFGSLTESSEPADIERQFDSDEREHSTTSTQLTVENHPPQPEPASVRTPVKELRRGRRDEKDPFTEEFDEEEVVLDSFAAWDEFLMGRNTPRVENQRDHGFAMRVRDAMIAVDSSVNEHSLHPGTESDSIDRSQRSAGDDSEPCESADLSDEPETEWQPIRLAIVTDSPRLTPVPLIAPADGVATTGAAAFDPVLPEEVETLSADPVSFDAVAPIDQPAVGCDDLSTSKTEPRWLCQLHDDSLVLAEDDPVLVIETEVQRPHSTEPSVRRENYRNLFLRLRSC